MKEYKGFMIEGRDDFTIQEVGENMTLFFFNPEYFEVEQDETKEFAKTLQCETNAAVTLNLSELYWGVITLVINPTILHYHTSEMIKESITRFLFDHRVVDDDDYDDYC